MSIKSRILATIAAAAIAAGTSMAPALAQQASGSYAPQRGWVWDGAWYYHDDNGNPATGWVWDGAWYYLNPDTGKMATGAFRADDGRLYAATPSGACPSSSWVFADGDWYLTDGSCAVRTGWAWDGAWYYLNPDTGKMATGAFRADDGRLYAATPSGACPSSSWVFADGDWYLTDGSCAVRTGWVDVDGSTYFLDPDTGRMATGTREIDGVSYAFDASGAREQAAQPDHVGTDQAGTDQAGTEHGGHEHSWATRTVVDQAAWDEPTYEERDVYEKQSVTITMSKVPEWNGVEFTGPNQVSDCGKFIASKMTALTSEYAARGEWVPDEYAISYKTVQKRVKVGTERVQAGTTHHDAVTHEERYCTTCGATA